MVQETDIVELELKSKRFSLSVRKKEALKAETTVVQMMAAPQPQQQQYAPAPQAAAPPPAAAAAPAAPAPAAAAPPPPPAVVDGVEVMSPMSGVLYRSPAPGEPPFVKEGDRVKKGQTVCIVEAMKLMNEIECDTDGVVVKLLVDNGGAVSPGMPLMLIKP
jgi:acetyl-CoA carboxylase biotin carboxyl carrier protein